MISADEIKTAHCKYQETVASPNFFIFLIAMVPPADKKGLIMSRM